MFCSKHVRFALISATFAFVGATVAPLSTFAATTTTTKTAAQPLSIKGTPATTATVGVAYSFKPTVTAPTGAKLSFTIGNKPSWAAFNTSTGQLSGTPKSSDVGEARNIVIQVNDGKTWLKVPMFSITVAAAPKAATTTAKPATTTASKPAAEPAKPAVVPFAITGTPATTATVGVAYSFKPTVTAPTGAKLSFTIGNKPSWASFNTSTGQLSGTPKSTDVGQARNIVIQVNDGKTWLKVPMYSITVEAAPKAAATTPAKPATTTPAPTTTKPAAPTTTTKPAAEPAKPVVEPLVVKGTPATTATVGVVYSFKPTVTAPAGAMLKFEIANKPSWATFSATTGQLSGTPKSSDVGTVRNVVIQVSDGKNYVNVPTYSIDVVAVSTGSATLNWKAPMQNEKGAALTSLAGYKVYWGTSKDNLANSTTISNVGLVRHVVENLGPGTYYFAMTSVTRSGTESMRSAIATKTIK